MQGMAQALSLILLLAGTLQYSILLEKRHERRWERQRDALIRDTGLQALVRITLIDEQMTRRQPRRRSLIRSHPFGRGPLLRRRVRLSSRTTPVWVSRLSSR
jgi:hypothetical protein